MTSATVNEPVSGYDSLKTKEVIASLSSHSQVKLTEIESYEHTHERKFRARREVLDEVDRLHRERRVPLASRDAKR